MRLLLKTLVNEAVVKTVNYIQENVEQSQNVGVIEVVVEVVVVVVH